MPGLAIVLITLSSDFSRERAGRLRPKAVRLVPLLPPIKELGSATTSYDRLLDPAPILSRGQRLRVHTEYSTYQREAVVALPLPSRSFYAPCILFLFCCIYPSCTYLDSHVLQHRGGSSSGQNKRKRARRIDLISTRENSAE